MSLTLSCDFCSVTTPQQKRNNSSEVYYDVTGWTRIRFPEEINTVDACPKCTEEIKKVLKPLMK